MDELKTMEELKLCPFCGNEPIMLHTRYPMTEYWNVKCVSCSAEINNPMFAEKEAIEAWNRRANDND